MSQRQTQVTPVFGKQFLQGGLNTADNKIIVEPSAMVETKNILIGKTQARRKRGGIVRFNTGGQDEDTAPTAYPICPENNGGIAGDPIIGLTQWRFYDTSNGARLSRIVVRQDDKVYSIQDRTTAAIDITGNLSLPTSGQVRFKAFENANGPALFWTSLNTAELINVWDDENDDARKMHTAKAPADWISFQNCTFTDVGDLVTASSHGFVNGDSVSFSVITTTTGISINTTYWVVNAAANTFQVSLTKGGAAINLVSNGTGTIKKLATAPTFLVSHLGRLWAGGVPEFPYRLYYSAALDGEDFSSAGGGGSIDLDMIGDDLGLTGAASFQNKLYIFLRNAIFELATPDVSDRSTWYVELLTEEVGCINFSTIQVIGNDVIYASDRGITSLRSTDKASQAEIALLSRDIQSTWNDQVDKNRLDQLCSVLDPVEGLYILSAPSTGSTANDIVLAMNLNSMAWMTWENVDLRSMTKVFISGRPVMLGGAENGRIVIFNDSTRLDVGTQYTAYFKTGVIYPGGNPTIEHVFKSITLLASTNSTNQVTIGWDIDGRIFGSKAVNLTSEGDLLTTTFVLGQSLLTQGSFIPRTVGISGKGYGVQLSVTWSGQGDVEIYGFLVETASADYKFS